MDGDHAAAKGAMAAGCRFVGRLSDHALDRGGRSAIPRGSRWSARFIQMEDEIASMAAILGAAWGGTKAMTVTSGPGFS
jgi:2-oxoglutarate ferredoxin oxidoreductase subunit alpha